ncbi:palmitoyltransferase ZDHHC15B-like [Rhipicephalus sanguineus]|uniref:palmitoyltransferase ZDHHC15B-like n=1 Tax=Rhipicephalus sanguineus TaxID=34632 RepID=UPI0018944990|nr:palmitoyltransferase ZDHHC15B-like [Rhipicephalus sanguineus]
MATLGEAYYAYLFVFCGRYVQEDSVRFALATVFHLPLLFCLWSYAQTTFTPPPCVPSCFQFTKDERLELVRCSRNTSSSVCVLKMDHHCPWFNNCVCFSTYKFFLLTLFYVVFLAAYTMASVAMYMLHKNPRRRICTARAT